jgi:hypothetical protein
MRSQKLRHRGTGFNRRLPAALALVLAFQGPATAAAQRSSVFLPGDVQTFEFPLASPRTSAIVGRVIHVGHGESQFGAEWEAEPALGEVWPLLAMGRGKVPLTLHLGSIVYGRFSLGDPSSAMISNDWHVNLILTADFRKLRLALEGYHESSHLGDEYRDRFPGPRVNWSREIVGLWARYQIGRAQLHGNVSYAAIDATDVGRGAIVLAAEHYGKRGAILGGTAQTILALHADAQAYTDWEVTWSGRAGIRLADPIGRRGFAFLLTFLDGFSNQRQFFLAKSRYAGIEVRFDM